MSEKENAAASFQQAVFEDVYGKIERACKEYGTNRVVFGGGVTNNMTLRDFLQKKLPGHQLIFPERALTLDNAAMIAGLAYHKWQGTGDPYCLEPLSRVSFLHISSKRAMMG